MEFNLNSYPEMRTAFLMVARGLASTDLNKTFSGQLCSLAGSLEIYDWAEGETQLKTYPVLKVFLLGRLSERGQPELSIDQGTSFLFAPYFRTIKVSKPLSLSAAIHKFKRKSRLDRRWSGLSALAAGGDPIWKLMLGTEDVLMEVERRLLPQALSECHERLLHTLFSLKVSKKEMEAFAPGLGRAREYLMEVNQAKIDAMRQEATCCRKEFEERMEALTLRQMPLLTLAHQHQAWLRHQGVSEE